jgi:hypothetical protein
MNIRDAPPTVIKDNHQPASLDMKLTTIFMRRKTNIIMKYI